MYEKEFEQLEGQSISIKKLEKELKKIVGETFDVETYEVNRSIALKPNFEQDWETYIITYHLNHKKDLIDVVFTTEKDQNYKRIKELPVKVQLISYISKAE
ncbi:hypothetical protein [Staphylococcus sp. 11261D007BR]